MNLEITCKIFCFYLKFDPPIITIAKNTLVMVFVINCINIMTFHEHLFLPYRLAGERSVLQALKRKGRLHKVPLLPR